MFVTCSRGIPFKKCIWLKFSRVFCVRVVLLFLFRSVWLELCVDLIVGVMKKVKFTLEQATKAQRGS